LLDKNPENKTDWLLFDLGNVLVELDGFPWFESTFPELNMQQIHRKWINLESVKLFETGRMDEAVFFEQVVKELEIPDSPQLFSKRYQAWVKGFFPGTRELLTNLKKNFNLACLSNTNPCHIDQLKHSGNELALFDRTFFSHEINFVKPDLLAFKHVVEALNTKPENILFFDDSVDNVEAALKSGIPSIHVSGFESLKAALENLEVEL